MSNRRRKIIVVILLFLTVLLASVTAYVAYRVSKENQSADDSSAATCTYGARRSDGACGCWEAHEYWPGATCGQGGENPAPSTSCSTVAWCAKWTCPQGDTNKDGMCTNRDTGASSTTSIGNACGSPGTCGQVDYYGTLPVGTYSSYCGHDLGSWTGCQSGGTGTTGAGSVCTHNGTGYAQYATRCEGVTKFMCGAGNHWFWVDGISCHPDCGCGATPPPAPTPTPTPPAPQCGQACGTGNACPTDHTCNNGTCILTQCINNANCTNNGCTPPAPACGNTCTTDAQCPNDGVHSCNNGTCVLDACIGNASCTNNGCTLPATPFCGDALCATGELCERVSTGSATYRSCTTNGSAPTGAIVSDCYGVAFSQPVTSATCKFCGDGVRQAAENCDPAIDANCNNDCTWSGVVNQCIDLVENGPDPIASASGNVITYILTYRHNSTTNPFPNIRLRVGPNGTEVGRDFYVNANDLIAPSSSVNPNPIYNTQTSEWTYIFTWEALDVGGGTVSASTYDVRVLTDGTDASIIATGACQDTVTVNQSASQEAVFIVNKSAVQSCGSNSEARITYTISVTNVGPVQGVIDFVEDTYDSRLASLGIIPSNITPSFGTVTGGTVRWEGTVSDRTFTSGQTKQYSYLVTIPRNQLLNFISGVNNQVEVQYTTDETNTTTFTLMTPITCTINGIPVTSFGGSLASRFVLIGFLLIILGIIVYRFSFGSVFIDKNFVSILLPFEKRVMNAEREKTKVKSKK